MLESNSPRDNRCDSSRTMGKGVAVWSRPFYDESSWPTNGRQHPALNLDRFLPTIGPIDRPCLGKLNGVRRRVLVATRSRPAQTVPNMLPMS